MKKIKKILKVMLIVLLSLTAFSYLLYITNNMFGYIPLGGFLFEMISYLIYYLPMCLAMVLSINLVIDKNLIIVILVNLFWVAVIIFSISPNLWGLLNI